MTRVDRLLLPDAVLIEPVKHADERGVFFETYRSDTLMGLGFTKGFVQENESVSYRRGTVRGLHFQRPPKGQAKLVRVISGAILDVIVDLRLGSHTYGRSLAIELTADSGKQLLVPEGFAHGFCTLTDDCRVLYKLSDFYSPSHEGGLIWSDPALAIDWPVQEDQAIVNLRDRSWPRLSELQSPFSPDKTVGNPCSRL